MTDYFDGPRGGIADYQGRPHLYESIFDDDAGEYSDIFRLSPIPEDLFELALEDWQICCAGKPPSTTEQHRKTRILRSPPIDNATMNLTRYSRIVFQ